MNATTTRSRCVICSNMYLEIIILTKPDHRMFRLLKDRRNHFFITLYNNPIFVIFWLFKQFLRVRMHFVVSYYKHTACPRTAKSVFLFLPNHFYAQVIHAPLISFYTFYILWARSPEWFINHNSHNNIYV